MKLVQGQFKPSNLKKYKGDAGTIFYRSSWELTFMMWCDQNPNIVEWASEEVVIPYRSMIDEEYERRTGKRKWHRYFIDFYVAIRTPDGLDKYLVEVKPLHETKEPIKTPRKRNSTYLAEQKKWIINTAKWRAAMAFCRERGLKFKIVTEVELYGRKP